MAAWLRQTYHEAILQSHHESPGSDLRLVAITELTVFEHRAYERAQCTVRQKCCFQATNEHLGL